MSKTLHGTEFNRIADPPPPVVVCRQQLYCAVRPEKCSLDWVRDGTSSATEHCWQMTTSCSMHAPKKLGRHGRRALNAVRY